MVFQPKLVFGPKEKHDTGSQAKGRRVVAGSAADGGVGGSSDVSLEGVISRPRDTPGYAQSISPAYGAITSGSSDQLPASGRTSLSVSKQTNAASKITEKEEYCARQWVPFNRAGKTRCNRNPCPFSHSEPPDGYKFEGTSFYPAGYVYRRPGARIAPVQSEPAQINVVEPPAPKKRAIQSHVPRGGGFSLPENFPEDVPDSGRVGKSRKTVEQEKQQQGQKRSSDEPEKPPKLRPVLAPTTTSGVQPIKLSSAVGHYNRRRGERYMEESDTDSPEQPEYIPPRPDIDGVEFHYLENSRRSCHVEAHMSTTGSREHALRGKGDEGFAVLKVEVGDEAHALTRSKARQIDSPDSMTFEGDNRTVTFTHNSARSCLFLPPEDLQSSITDERETWIYPHTGSEPIVQRDSWREQRGAQLPFRWKGKTLFFLSLVAMADSSGVPHLPAQAAAAAADDSAAGDVVAPGDPPAASAFGRLRPAPAGRIWIEEDTITPVGRPEGSSGDVVDLEGDPVPPAYRPYSSDDPIDLEGEPAAGDDDVQVVGDDVIQNRDYRSEIRSKLLADYKRKYPGKSDSELDMMVHSALGHFPYRSTCRWCVAGNQRRKPHDRQGNRTMDMSWSFDLMGPADPPSLVNGNEYILCGYLHANKDAGGKRELYGKTVADMSAQETVDRLRALAIEQQPTTPSSIITGQDNNFLGVCKEWFDEKEIHHDRRARYTPWRNPSENAVKKVQNITSPALLESNLPMAAWELALEHNVAKENALNGMPGWRDLPIHLLAPTGSLVGVVREGVKETDTYKKFGPKSWFGFLAGCKLPDLAVVGYEKPDGSYGFIESQNVTVFPDQKYFESSQNPPDTFFRIRGDVAREALEDDDQEVHTNETISNHVSNVMVFPRQSNTSTTTTSVQYPEVHHTDQGDFSTSATTRAPPQSGSPTTHDDLSSGERAIPKTSSDGSLDRKELSRPHTQGFRSQKFNAEIFHYENECVQLMYENESFEVHQFEGISRKRAFDSSLEWFQSGKSNAEVFKAASAEEVESFTKTNTVDLNKHRTVKSWANENPNGTILLLNLILGTKGVEAYYSKSEQERKEMKGRGLRAKARLVCFKEVKASTRQSPTGDVRKDEGLHSEAPSGLAIRMWQCIMVAARKLLIQLDYKWAYQNAMNRDDHTVVCIWPRELWPDHWNSIYDPKEQVCVPVSGSFYGRKRAGDDFQFYVNSVYSHVGWMSLKDAEPTQYLHDVDVVHKETDVDIIEAHKNAIPILQFNYDDIKDDLFKGSCGSWLYSDNKDILDFYNNSMLESIGDLELLEAIKQLPDTVGTVQKSDDSLSSAANAGPDPQASSEFVIPAVHVKDSLCRYADDVLIGVSSKLALLYTIDQMAKYFLIGPPESAIGRKFIGNTMSVRSEECPADGSIDFELTWQQIDLLGKYISEFEELSATRKCQYKLKDRVIPSPSSDVHIPRTREEEEQRAALEAQQDDDFKAGVYSDVALHFINGLAYVCEGSRPDLSFTINDLQQMSNRFGDEADKRLTWLMGYARATKDKCLKGYINSHDLASGDLYLLIQSDASHGANRRGRRSIGSYSIYLKGPRTSVLLMTKTKTIKAVTLSSAESELAIAQDASKDGLKAKMMLDILLGYDHQDGLLDKGAPIGLELDALAAIAAIKKSASGKLSHSRRTIGISLYWMHEVWVENKRKGHWISHRRGYELSADAGTKALSESAFARHMRTMGIFHIDTKMNADQHMQHLEKIKTEGHDKKG